MRWIVAIAFIAGVAASQAEAGAKDDLVKAVVTIKSKVSAGITRAGLADQLGDLRTAIEIANIQKAVAPQALNSVEGLSAVISQALVVWERSINVCPFARGQGTLRQIIDLTDKMAVVKGHASECRDEIAKLTALVGYTREETFQILGEEFVASGLVNMALSKVSGKAEDSIGKLTGTPAAPAKKP